MCTDPSDGVAVHHRPHAHRRPAAAHHQGLQGVDGVDVARSARRGGLRRARRHRAGEPRQHQADRGGAVGPGHRRGDRRTRGGPSGPARHAWALQLSPDGNVWGATINKTVRRRREASTTSSSHCSRRAAASRAATPTTLKAQRFPPTFGMRNPTTPTTSGQEQTGGYTSHQCHIPGRTPTAPYPPKRITGARGTPPGTKNKTQQPPRSTTSSVAAASRTFLTPDFRGRIRAKFAGIVGVRAAIDGEHRACDGPLRPRGNQPCWRCQPDRRSAPSASAR